MNTTSISNRNIPFTSSFPKSFFTTPKACSLPHRSPRHFPSPSFVIETAQGQVYQDNTSDSVARRLLLLRHAKISWETLIMICIDGPLSNRLLFVEIDHDRPLSESGRTDAVNVSRKLQQLGWIPQLILLWL
ncbi:hypothetical protein RJ641_004999 [Dillenia turbinata]|uniref:Uncharacterized protein n=1 Tax=Dillenia turbinata TaxID=194707 RepID=A0AAN8V8H9_9MAGN